MGTQLYFDKPPGQWMVGWATSYGQIWDLGWGEHSGLGKGGVLWNGETFTNFELSQWKTLKSGTPFGDGWVCST